MVNTLISRANDRDFDSVLKQKHINIPLAISKRFSYKMIDPSGLQSGQSPEKGRDTFYCAFTGKKYYMHIIFESIP